MDLHPNLYVAAHLRALYGKVNRKNALLQQLATNALTCATQTRLQVPIFFAFDRLHATKYPLQYGTCQEGRVQNLIVVSSPIDSDPSWHLDKEFGPAVNFYDTFIDKNKLRERCEFHLPSTVDWTYSWMKTEKDEAQSSSA